MTDSQKEILIQVYKETNAGDNPYNKGTLLANTEANKKYIRDLRALLDEGYISLKNNLEGVRSGAGEVYVLNPIYITQKGIEFVEAMTK